MKDLVIFDVDNTIVKGQSQQLFLDYLRRKKIVPFLYYLRITIWFILYKLGIEKSPKKVMEYAYSFLNGKTRKEMDIIMTDFFSTVLKKMIFPEIFTIIEKHKKEGHKMILVSNATDIIIKKIADYLNVDDFIATKLEIINNVYTGKIIGNMMYGENKCKALRQYTESNGLILKNSWSYADHESDVPLFLEITHPCAVNPSKKLREVATTKNWPVLNFKL